MNQLPKEGIFIIRSEEIIVHKPYGTFVYRITDFQLFHNDKGRSIY